uniref:ATP synthase epsilon chain, chloroplastic n=1 Tax=Lepocinclis steinii TaxID=459226 RepID=A0A3G3LLP0_9EUGL|nr:ATPase epsilon subunit [Lepocinclis steinii]AYQ93618.1 ATPase epsilon subunit [Lepocinclis steinii]
MSLEVSIIVPDRVFWRSNAKEIILPTLSGQMGVLKDHIPLLTGLDTGVMKVRSETDSRWLVMAVMGGFALVNNNKVTILVNEAELGSDINYEQAEQTYLEAKSSLDNLIASDGKDKLEAVLRLKKSKARFL